MAHTQTLIRCLVGMAIWSCCLTASAQQWHFSIDIMHPAQRSGLGMGQTVLVVNNTVPQPAVFGHTTASDGANSTNDSINLDEAPLRCLFHLTQGLEAARRFARVELMDESLNGSGLYYTRRPLPIAQAERLCLDYDAEVLIILDQIILYDLLEDFVLRDRDTYFAYLQAYCQAHWTIHRAGSSRDSSFVTSDTLTWESDNQSTRRKALTRLPLRQDALLYMAEEVGSNVAWSLTPQWQTVKRYVYENADTTLTRGIDLFRQRRWQQAIDVWKPLLDRADKKTAAYAAADIAIAYEMQSLLILADDYACRAMNLFDAVKGADNRQQAQNMHWYRVQLQARLAEANAL